MGPIVGRGVLLDVVALRGGPLADGAVITASDLERAAKAAGVVIGKGDIVLIRTGWADHQARQKVVSFDAEPGLDLEAGLWLAEREIAVLGADNFAVEVLPFAQGSIFPLHQRLIRDFGIPLLEGLVLDRLAAAVARRVHVCGKPVAGGWRHRQPDQPDRDLVVSRLNHCLRGVRVLDLSSYLPGPFASLVLADFGAQVLKIEPPRGDGMRLLGPREADGTPVFHAALNAGKTICRLDLKSEADRNSLLTLARDADVLIEGFRPGVMARLGLGWVDLHEAN